LLKRFDTTTPEKIEVWACGCKSINGSRSQHSDACIKRQIVNERAKRANGITESLGVTADAVASTILFDDLQWGLGIWTDPKIDYYKNK
jgi:hypothetical protein